MKDLVIRHDPLPFVLNATVGNLLALCGSFFLVGPAAQMRRMWHQSRRSATLIYVGSLFLTLVVAFLRVPGPKGLILLLLMICQYVAIMWYTLSYIPFAQDLVAGFMRRRWGGGESI
jgi:drug/metabolite transporter (DMT)-like permease